MSSFFWPVFANNTTTTLVDFLLMPVLFSCFSERNVTKKTALLTCFGALLLISLSSTALTIEQIATNGLFFATNGLLLYFFLINIIQTLTFIFIFKQLPRTFVFLMVCLLNALTDFLFMCSELTSVFFPNIVTTQLRAYLVRLVASLLIWALIYFLIRLCQKIRVIEAMKILLTHPYICFFTALTMIMSKLVSFRLLSHATALVDKKPIPVLNILFFGIVILMVMLLIRAYLLELKQREMTLVVAQQREYLKRLENIQKKLRIINHDYKNVAAGLYLTAASGDTKGVKNYVNTQLLQLDDELQLEISQMNQLVNVSNLELKSLLMTKIFLATEQNVSVKLEINVLRLKLKLPNSELLRCMGIILDNAIEAAALTSERKVSVVIFEEFDMTIILVKNSMSGKVHLDKIFKQGYSSKGENRGLGLYSLNTILKKYPTIFLETKVEKQQFIQIMKLT